MAKPRSELILSSDALPTISRSGFKVFWAIGYVIFFCALAPATQSAQHRATPQPVRSGTVKAMVDGDTLILRSGVQVRLVGIQAPKLPLGRRGFKTWPLATESKAALTRLTAGKTLSLSYPGRKNDRHGRLLAHLKTPEGTWVQGALLRDGMARVYTFPDNRARAAEMLELEQVARAERRGIWALAYYRIRNPSDLRQDMGSFQLIEATVKDTAVVRGRAYLNFGQNWRTDFTISISPRWMRRHWRNGPKIEQYKGRKIRVRGWLKSFNGPLIEATHPEQVELLP